MQLEAKKRNKKTAERTNGELSSIESYQFLPTCEERRNMSCGMSVDRRRTVPRSRTIDRKDAPTEGIPRGLFIIDHSAITLFPASSHFSLKFLQTNHLPQLRLWDDLPNKFHRFLYHGSIICHHQPNAPFATSQDFHNK